MKINIPKIDTERIQKEYRNGIEVYIKREDKTHPKVSGNKYRKLKYNVEEAFRQKAEKIITFGGAYSNHISATAAAGKICDIRTIGVIRGDELEKEIENNPTLSYARECGMEFLFVSREEFRLKHTEEFKRKLKEMFGEYYYVPEGGTNSFAIKGCEEILNEEDKEKYDYICCAMGTGGTISGIINSSEERQEVLGFPSLNGEFLNEVVRGYTNKNNWKIILDYNLGGYAKVNEEYIEFLNNFYKETGVPLDPVYTGKMMYGVEDLIRKGYFREGSKILTIHTGGLQGILGMNKLLKKKGKNIIGYEKEVG